MSGDGIGVRMICPGFYKYWLSDLVWIVKLFNPLFSNFLFNLSFFNQKKGLFRVKFQLNRTRDLMVQVMKEIQLKMKFWYHLIILFISLFWDWICLNLRFWICFGWSINILLIFSCILNLNKNKGEEDVDRSMHSSYGSCCFQRVFGSLKNVISFLIFLLSFFRVDESWISPQPYLLFTYLNQVFSFLISHSIIFWFWFILFHEKSTHPNYGGILWKWLDLLELKHTKKFWYFSSFFMIFNFVISGV